MSRVPKGMTVYRDEERGVSFAIPDDGRGAPIEVPHGPGLGERFFTRLVWLVLALAVVVALLSGGTARVAMWFAVLWLVSTLVVLALRRAWRSGLGGQR